MSLIEETERLIEKSKSFTCAKHITSSNFDMKMNSARNNPSFKSPNLYLQECTQIDVIEKFVFEISLMNVYATTLKKPTYAIYPIRSSEPQQKMYILPIFLLLCFNRILAIVLFVHWDNRTSCVY